MKYSQLGRLGWLSSVREITAGIVVRHSSRSAAGVPAVHAVADFHACSYDAVPDTDPAAMAANASSTGHTTSDPTQPRRGVRYDTTGALPGSVAS
ncbi:hypothetical protein ACH4VM_24585 [Streptomyces sp. NPDC020792]|uniref:hypothetical protein n=1 Tax=Streptomyces sp. NPDC020792 TaxID=3365089 RepID=UPI0037ADFEA0